MSKDEFFFFLFLSAGVSIVKIIRLSPWKRSLTLLLLAPKCTPGAVGPKPFWLCLKIS